MSGAGQLLTLILYQMTGLLFSPLFWLVVVVIALQTRRAAKMKRDFFQVPQDNVVKKTIQGVALGLFGGFIGSILLVILGVSAYEIGIEYLWMLAVILFLINQRFMCFAYAGGILALSNYLFGWPLVNIPQMIALIAVLHLVEAILILCSGHLQAMPVYVMGKDQKLVGGFNMQNFWPLPLVALSAALAPELQATANILAMPDWWPLLPTEYLGLQVGSNVVYTMLPVLAALGYSDLALTALPKEKAFHSAKQLLVYSILLLVLAVFAAKVPFMAILAALFSPLGHELLIRIGQKKEMTGDYLFQSPVKGMMILDCLDHYPAQKAGLQSADVILQINTQQIDSQADFLNSQSLLPNHLTITYLRQGQTRQCTLEKWDGQSLGIIPVPEPDGLDYLDFRENFGLLKTLIAQCRRWFKKLGRPKSL